MNLSKATLMLMLGLTAMPVCASSVHDGSYLEEITKREMISSGGNPSYLWLAPEQKEELSKALTSITNITSEAKVAAFDGLLKNMAYANAAGNLFEEIKLFKKYNTLTGDLEQSLSILSGDPSYLWLATGQKEELFKTLTEITNITPEAKVEAFDALLKKMAYVNAAGNLSEEIKLFKKYNTLTGDLEQSLSILSGDPSYLWLTTGQKEELFKTLTEITNIAPEAKFAAFNTLLEKMKQDKR